MLSIAKFCVVLAHCVVERHPMASEPSFKFRGCETYWVSVFRADVTWAWKTIPLERQFLSKRHCSFFLQLHALSRAWSCVGCAKNRLIVSLYIYSNLLYVRHATVAQFESVSVEDFPQFVASREAVIDKA